MHTPWILIVFFACVRTARPTRSVFVISCIRIPTRNLDGNTYMCALKLLQFAPLFSSSCSEGPHYGLSVSSAPQRCSSMVPFFLIAQVGADINHLTRSIVIAPPKPARFFFVLITAFTTLRPLGTLCTGCSKKFVFVFSIFLFQI